MSVREHVYTSDVESTLPLPTTSTGPLHYVNCLLSPASEPLEVIMHRCNLQGRKHAKYALTSFCTVRLLAVDELHSPWQQAPLPYCHMAAKRHMQIEITVRVLHVISTRTQSHCILQARQMPVGYKPHYQATVTAVA